MLIQEREAATMQKYKLQVAHVIGLLRGGYGLAPWYDFPVSSSSDYFDLLNYVNTRLEGGHTWQEAFATRPLHADSAQGFFINGPVDRCPGRIGTVAAYPMAWRIVAVGDEPVIKGWEDEREAANDEHQTHR